MAEGEHHNFPGWNYLKPYHDLIIQIQTEEPRFYKDLLEILQPNEDVTEVTSTVVPQEYRALEELLARNTKAYDLVPCSAKTVGIDVGTQTNSPPAMINKETHCLKKEHNKATQCCTVQRSMASQCEPPISWRPTHEKDEKKMSRKQESASSLLDVLVERPQMEPVKPRRRCYNCGSIDHMYSACKKPIDNPFCYHCGKPGVKINNCPRCGPKRRAKRFFHSSQPKNEERKEYF